MTLKKSLPFKSNLVRVMNISNSYILDSSLKNLYLIKIYNLHHKFHFIR